MKSDFPFHIIGSDTSITKNILKVLNSNYRGSQKDKWIQRQTHFFSFKKSSEKYGYVRKYGRMIEHPSVPWEAAFVMPLGPVEMSDSNR